MRNVTFKITCTALAENLPRVLQPKKQCFKTVPGLDNLLTSLKIFWSKLFKEFFTSGSWGGSSGSCTFLAHWDLGGKLLVQNFNYFLFRVLNSKQFRFLASVSFWPPPTIHIPRFTFKWRRKWKNSSPLFLLWLFKGYRYCSFNYSFRIFIFPFHLQCLMLVLPKKTR